MQKSFSNKKINRVTISNCQIPLKDNFLQHILLLLLISNNFTQNLYGKLINHLQRQYKSREVRGENNLYK